MLKPLTNILTKIFVNSFYKAHVPILIILLFVVIAPGTKVVEFHQSLMLYIAAKPLAMFVCFCMILVYTFKSWHSVFSIISEVHHQFLFYSINSYSKFDQLFGWIVLQVLISLPILLYMLCTIVVAISHLYFLSAFIIFFFIVSMLLSSAFLYYWRINKLIDGSKQSIILNLTHSLKKPFYSLFIYYVFDNLKLKYLLIKLLSYLLITGVFLMFADVKTDVRVAGVAMLAIAIGHSMLILKEREFDGTFLMFAKILPKSRLQLFTSQICMYSFLLLPEAIWLLFNLPVLVSAGQFLFCISIIMLFVSSLHLIGYNQDRYLQIVLGLFFVIFLFIIYNLIWPLVLINILVSYSIFYFSYYKFKANPTFED